jgi:hypothetical protein
MLLTDFISWWYTTGWKLRLASIFSNVARWLEYFSIGTLLKTMFAPWRQNVSYVRPDQGLNLKLNAKVDNLVSRFVGFFVRINVLILAAIIVFLVFLLSIVFVIIWPLLPLAPIIIIIVGVSL